MKLLALTYVLPPNLYPQAIQIGRLLNSVDAEIGAVSGKVESHANGLDVYPGFDKKLTFRLEVPFKKPRASLWRRLAVEVVPFYARIPDEFRGWVGVAESAALEKLKDGTFRPDVMVSFGEPMSDHLLGLRLKRKLGLPWVAHFSDPWSDNPFRRRHLLSNMINKRLERSVIQLADRIVFTSEETADLVMRKYPAAWRDRVRVLPHSYEPSLYPSVSQKQGPLRIRYMGNFYGHRSPRPLFEGLLGIFQESPELLEGVSVELIGGIPSRMLRARAYKMLPPGLVKCLPTVSYSQSLRCMAEADMLLVIDAPGKVSVFLPSKLIDYLGAGVPIFGITPPGASSALIEKLGGATVFPGSGLLVAPLLREAIEAARSFRHKQALSAGWGVPAVKQTYRSDQVAAEFRHILDEVLSGL